MQALVDIKYGDTEGVLTGKFLLFNLLFDFLEVINGSVRVKLSTHHDVPTVRRNINAVRALGFRNQEKRIIFDSNFHRNYTMPVNDPDIFLILGELSNFLPVENMQIVMVITAHAGFIGRHTDLDATGIHLRIK